MDAKHLLDSFTKERGYRKQIVRIEEIPRRPVQYAPESFTIPEAVGRMLKRVGFERLYSHQAEAIGAARAGNHVIVVTGAASGKSLCYNVPVLEAMTSDARARAMYLFPTKALAQDQLGKLNDFGLGTLTQAETYDGDTPQSRRRAIRQLARIVLTNPDMLHISILPSHQSWSQFLRNLRYVVIDEVHTYRGVFGSHVGNVLRRLMRVCASYGSSPQFIAASATIPNPEELMKLLTGLDFTVVSSDGSPTGKKYFALWNPPFISQQQGRRSANSEAAELFVKLVEEGIRTIVFTRARVTAELIARYARAKLSRKRTGLNDRVTPYRTGYTPEQRRAIEQRFFHGDLLGIASTSALELGVDVGDLDAVILTGYPGSVSRTWQQVGRAGRRSEQSLALLVGMDDALDQYLMRNPDYLFTTPVERAVADPGNEHILAAHALCAAYELPLEESDLALFGPKLADVVRELERDGSLVFKGRWFWAGGQSPAGTVNIRSISGRTFVIVNAETGDMLGTVDEGRAYETVHPGAVYLHEGESYLVETLDIGAAMARVRPLDAPYYTQPSTLNSVRVESVDESKECGAAAVCIGKVKVSNKVVGYRTKRLFTDQMIQYVPLDLPEQEFVTRAVWLVIPKHISEKVGGSGYDLAGSLHAAEHCSIGLVPLFAMCDRYDMGGVSHPQHPDLGGLAGIFIYDAYAGGVGIAEVAYEQIEALLESVIATIRACPCEDGCPSCVQSPKCGNNNQPLDKVGARFMLTEMLRHDGLRAE